MTDITEINKEESPKNTFTLAKQENGIAHLVMDVVGDAVNTLKAEFAEEIIDILRYISISILSMFVLELFFTSTATGVLV